MENNKSYKLVRHLGILAAPMGEVAKTVSIVRWGDLEPSLDIRKKPVPPEKEGIIHFAGLVFFMVLMVIVFFNDLVNIFAH